MEQRQLNLILAGGVTEAKYQKIAQNLKDTLSGKGIAISTRYVNTYEKHDFSGLKISN